MLRVGSCGTIGAMCGVMWDYRYVGKEISYVDVQI